MVRNKNQTENERQPHHVGENFSVVPSVIKRNRNIHTAAEGVLLSAGSTIRMEGKKMKFNDGGLFCFDRDESCFIKYLVTQIQTAQLHLRNDQLDVNADFEECIAAIRKFEEPLCVAAWLKMRCNQKNRLLDDLDHWLDRCPQGLRGLPLLQRYFLAERSRNPRRDQTRPGRYW